MKKPTSNISEVLFKLIRRESVSSLTIQWPGFRTRLSELKTKYGLSIQTTLVKDKNKYGNPYYYAVHKLPQSERNKAVKLYDKLIAN